MGVGFFSANTTIKIEEPYNDSGESSSPNQSVWTVPDGKVFVGVIKTSSGGWQTGVEGGGNCVMPEGLVLLSGSRTVRIVSSGVKWVISGILIQNSP